MSILRGLVVIETAYTTLVRLCKDMSDLDKNPRYRDIMTRIRCKPMGQRRSVTIAYCIHIDCVSHYLHLINNSDKKVTLIRVVLTFIAKTITEIGQFWTRISSALALGINTHVSSIVEIGGRGKPIVRTALTVNIQHNGAG